MANGGVSMKRAYYTSFFNKSREALVNKCLDAIKDGQKVVYILPSREAMFDVRNRFIDSYGGIVDSYIFGFADLEKLICQDKIPSKKVIYDNVIELILKDILAKNKDNSIFNPVKNKLGFIDGVYQLIKRLKRLNISPEEFRNRSKLMEGILEKKCSFLADIYQEYEAFKKAEGIYDLNDYSLKACEEIKHCELFSQLGVLVVDGFINIDPVNKLLLKNISEIYPETDLYANIPYKNIHNQAFLQEEILKDLEELGFTVEDNIGLGTYPVEPSIKNLAENLYSGRKVLTEDAPGIKIINSPCIEHEVRQGAKLIKERLFKGETSPDKVVIYVQNLDQYRENIHDVFEEMGIPVQLISSEKLMSVSLIKDALSLFKVSVEAEEAVGFINLVSSKYLIPAAILEKNDFETVFLHGVAKRTVKVVKPSKYWETFKSLINKHNSLEVIKDEIEKYIDLISDFSPKRFASREECLKAFLNLLKALNLRGNIITLHHNGILNTEEYIRDLKALETMENILDEFLELSRIYPNSYQGDIFQGIYRDLINRFLEAEIGIRRLDNSGVKALNPDQARGRFYDFVLILGVNEGLFPCISRENLLFNLQEDQELFQCGINLIHSRWELEREKIRFNQCLAFTVKEVILSYRTSDEEGGYLIKSPFIDEVESLMGESAFRKTNSPTIYMRDRFLFQEKAMSLREGLRKIADRVWQKKGQEIEHLEYLSWILKEKELKDKLDYIHHSAQIELGRMNKPYFDNYDGLLSSPQLAQQDAAYGFSPSQLNSYVSCPFKYYSERVLGLSSLDEEDGLGARSLGSFYHEILREYYNQNENWYNYDEDRLKQLFNDRVVLLNEGNLSSKVFQFVREEQWSIISAFVQQDANNLQYYYDKTGHWLKPIMLEQPVNIKHSFGGNLIRGVIDRIDLEINEKGEYTGKFIIYDYKSSYDKTTLKECVETKDFQLPIYCLAIEDYLKKNFALENSECLALVYYCIKTRSRKGIVKKAFKKQLFEGRTGPRDLVGENNFTILMEWISSRGGQLIDEIRLGKFILPEACSSDDDFFSSCIYRPICRYDRYRIAIKQKVGETDA